MRKLNTEKISWTLRISQGVKWQSPGLLLGTGPRGTAGNEGDRESTKVPTSCCGLTHTGAREPRPGQALSWQMGRAGSRPATLLGKASASSPSPGLNDWEPIHILSFSLSHCDVSQTGSLACLPPHPLQDALCDALQSLRDTHSALSLSSSSSLGANRNFQSRGSRESCGNPQARHRVSPSFSILACKMPLRTSQLRPLPGEVPTPDGPPSHLAMWGLTCQKEAEMSPSLRRLP